VRKDEWCEFDRGIELGGASCADGRSAEPRCASDDVSAAVCAKCANGDEFCRNRQIIAFGAQMTVRQG
jgi:hypothetical protein